MDDMDSNPNDDIGIAEVNNGNASNVYIGDYIDTQGTEYLNQKP